MGTPEPSGHPHWRSSGWIDLKPAEADSDAYPGFLLAPQAAVYQILTSTQQILAKVSGRERYLRHPPDSAVHVTSNLRMIGAL
jgi:hypothetical protein